MAFNAGWSDKQFASFQEWSDKETNAAMSKRDEGIADGKKEAEIQLKKDWGSDYDLNFIHMRKGVKEFGGDEFLQKLGPAGNLPEVINFLVEKGRSLKNDSLLDSDLDSKKTTPPNQILYPSMKDM
jgi:hypothetical protein